LSESLALLGVDALSPQTYVGGATLANGARITNITADYIVLSKDGRSARLYRQGSGTAVTNRPELASLLLNVGGSQSAPAAMEASREPITDYLRPSPIYSGDALRGFQVYAGNRAGVFAQMGLQPGDVITALNGVPLTDPTSGVGMLEELAHGATLNAQVERKGQTLSLTLDGGLIVSAEQTLTAASATPPLMP
jgi:general secretion pathway protein C